MSREALPKTYRSVKTRYSELTAALEALGKAAKNSGPITEKHAQLIQLAAAASIRSEGAVHSHARQAVAAGASLEEVRHTIVLLTSTIGFPTAVAALSWVDDVLK